ncbi:hypothetical protein AAF712_010921 [Marasmius tenuissimus]|uniref:Uncharacterized protein n=1 Tax=Marasmius tenuissimus TaxID=585030 RepID=A0ABR2ZMG3_9AGAR
MLSTYPLGEYTPPGCRQRWAIAGNIETVEFEIETNDFLLWVAEESLREIAGGRGCVEDKESHLKEQKRLQIELKSLKVRLRELKEELAYNNAQRGKIYHHFPAQKILQRRRR